MAEKGKKKSEPTQSLDCACAVPEEENVSFPFWSKLWRPRLITFFKRSLRWLPLVLLGLWVISGFYIVKQDETAVVRRFGKVVEAAVPPGIRWALPWPIDKVDKVKTTEIKRMSIGYRIIDDIQGIPPAPMEIQRLTGDTSIIQIKVMVQYQVTNPSDYLFGTRAPHWFIRKFGEAALTSIVASMSVDDVLTTGKLQIQSSVRREIQSNLDRLGTGITLISCNLQEVSPPLDVVDAFNDVSRAKSDKERIKNQAQSYRNDLLPKARGAAEEMRNKAETYYSEAVNKARGEAASFLSLLTEFRKAPIVTRQRLFLEIVEQVLPKAKKVVIRDVPESAGKTIIID